MKNIKILKNYTTEITGIVRIEEDANAPVNF